MEMKEILEKARQMYPIGTKIRGMYDGGKYVINKNIFAHYDNIYTVNDDFEFICLYNSALNKWAEIIREETMTQEEFNDLKTGDFINNYEILHKYNEFLIVRCNDGHDLFDIAKINKLGLKVKPKTFMGLEVKKYDNVPCEIGGNSLVYLAEVRIDDVLIRIFKTSSTHSLDTTSIRIL